MLFRQYRIHESEWIDGLYKANKRPLLANRKGEELQAFIAEGLARREPFYSQAHLSASGSDEEILDQICKHSSTL